jgi:hypothetical protein
MFFPDETAKGLFRRLSLPAIRFGNFEKMDKIDFGEVYEIQVAQKDQSESVLSMIFQFQSQCLNGLVYHLSTGNYSFF